MLKLFFKKCFLESSREESHLLITMSGNSSLQPNLHKFEFINTQLDPDYVSNLIGFNQQSFKPHRKQTCSSINTSSSDPFFHTGIKIEPSDPLDLSEIKIEPNTLETDYELEIKIEENDVKHEAYDVGDHNYVFDSRIEHSYAKKYEQDLHIIGNIKKSIKNQENTNISDGLNINNAVEEEIVADNENNLEIVDVNEFADGHTEIKLENESNCVETTEGVAKKFHKTHKLPHLETLLKKILKERGNPVNKDLRLKPPELVPGIPDVDALSEGGDGETISENKSIGKVEVPEQLKWNASKTFKCRICHYCTAHEAFMKNHVTRHARQKVFECTHCEYKTIYKRFLKQHKMSHMPPYKCSACNFNTTCKLTLNEHTKTHIKYEWKLNEDMKTRIKHEVFICPYCGYKTGSKANLNEHMRIHSVEKWYHCTECTYSTKQKYHLIKHLELHASVMPYVCKICLYRTKDEESLLLHAEIHETSLNCPICGFKTDKTFVMENHMVKHIGKKSHRCNKCDFVTRQYVEFILHKRSHLNTVQCEVYNEKTSEEAFKTHRESRTVKCSECDLVAVNNAALRVHIRNNHAI